MKPGPIISSSQSWRNERVSQAGGYGLVWCLTEYEIDEVIRQGSISIMIIIFSFIT